MGGESATASTAGRPRDRVRHGAVLDAVRAIVADVGYSKLTIDAVAERAGVSRTLVYRWWASKAELVQEALFPFLIGRPTPDTGTLEGDLRVLVQYQVESFSRPEMMRGLPGLVADLEADPALRERAEQEFAAPASERWIAVFRRAAERGEVDAGIDATLGFEAATGMIIQLLRLSDLRRQELVDYMVGILLRGLGGTVRRGSGPASSGGGIRSSRGTGRSKK